MVPVDPIQALADAAAAAAEKAEDLAADALVSSGVIGTRTPELLAEFATA